MVIDSDLQPSKYVDGRSIRDEGNRLLSDLLARAQAGDVSGSEKAGFDQKQVVEVTMSGGGPGWHLLFVMTLPNEEEPQEIVEAYSVYFESGGVSSTYVTPWDAKVLWKALFESES